MISDQTALFDIPGAPAGVDVEKTPTKKAPTPAPARPEPVAGLSPAGMLVVECVPTDATRAAVAEGFKAFEAATREHGPADEWDRRVIDQAIRAFARQGQPFSANDIRPLLPVVRVCLISRRFIVARRDGILEWTGTITPSTLASTKAAGVKVWRPTVAAATAPLVREAA